MFSATGLAGIAGMILYLRENWDGNGYLHGLYPRSYACLYSKEEALEELDRCSGVQFDSKLLPLLKKVLYRIAGQEYEQQGLTAE